MAGDFSIIHAFSLGGVAPNGGTSGTGTAGPRFIPGRSIQRRGWTAILKVFARVFRNYDARAEFPLVANLDVFIFIEACAQPVSKIIAVAPLGVTQRPLARPLPCKSTT